MLSYVRLLLSVVLLGRLCHADSEYFRPWLDSVRSHNSAAACCSVSRDSSIPIEQFLRYDEGAA